MFHLGFSFNKRQENEEAFFQKHWFMALTCFPMFPSFPYRKRCFQCQFLFSRCKLRLRYTAGNSNENPSLRALAKILRARGSEQSFYFCEQFASKFCEHFQTWWTIRYPSHCNRHTVSTNNCTNHYEKVRCQGNAVNIGCWHVTVWKGCTGMDCYFRTVDRLLDDVGGIAAGIETVKNRN